MRTLVLVALALTGFSVTAQAQLPPGRRNAAASIDPAKRVIVTNASVEGDCTPAEALSFSGSLRTKLAKLLDGKFTVVTKEQMNAALKAYGYPADEILPPTEAERLGDMLKAANVVLAKLTKGASGRLEVVASVKGKGEVTLAQAEGQSLGDFGSAVAALVVANIN
jgi:hypothetical protein